MRPEPALTGLVGAAVAILAAVVAGWTAATVTTAVTVLVLALRLVAAGRTDRSTGPPPAPAANTLTPVDRLANRLGWALSGDRRGLAYGLRPQLRRVAAAALAQRGVDLDGDPEPVRRLLGAEGWALLHDAPTVDRDGLDRLLRALEECEP
ncbi:hypothetical protein [Actinocatenispora comari]|uniref:Uncharacterized protein n=1 Tax=Actinocatenispora comari TaxID=2807577 RepID=A0A8J4EHW1_9ACTN|nr:hypothetical protein [Actinocatenispora comari]GIL25447.1 hypothetical protein NUM_07020 [Actinocatenispora comari]